MARSLDRLVVLESLLRTRSPTATARELEVTQSAVSKSLATLRDELGDALLLRRGDRMVPTPRAEALATPLAAALSNLRSVLADPDAAPRPASVVVAMRDQFVVSLGPPLLRLLSEASPETQLQIEGYDRERVAEALARGAADVAIAVDPPDRPGLVQKALYRETFVSLSPSRRPPTLRVFLAARHVVVSAHQGFARVDAALAELGHRRRVVARVPYFTAAVHLAEKEGLFLTVPARVASALTRRRLHAHPLPFAVPGFSAHMIWDARFEREPKSRWLRDLVCRAASSGT